MGWDRRTFLGSVRSAQPLTQILCLWGSQMELEVFVDLRDEPFLSLQGCWHCHCSPCQMQVPKLTVPGVPPEGCVFSPRSSSPGCCWSLWWQWPKFQVAERWFMPLGHVLCHQCHKCCAICTIAWHCQIIQWLELLLRPVLVQDSSRWGKLSAPFQVDVSFIAKMLTFFTSASLQSHTRAGWTATEVPCLLL